MLQRNLTCAAVLILILASFTVAGERESWLPQSEIVLNGNDFVNNDFNDFTGAPPVCLGTDELVEETFGTFTTTFTGSNRSRGNIFLVDSTVNLYEHRFHLILTTAMPLCFFVYQGTAFEGIYNLVDSVTLDNQGPGDQFYASDVRNFSLTQGYYYFLGAAWPDNATYGRDTGSTPPFPCSFGSIQIGVGASLTSYPISPTVSHSRISYQAYHQMVITGSLEGLSVTLTPANPPIVIATGGGVFNFGASVENTSSSTIIFDAWTMVTLPNGAAYGPLVRRNALSAPPGANIQRNLSQYVPGAAPAGLYTYNGYVGSYPDSIVAEDSFEFTKLAGEGSSNHNEGWACYGWDDDEELIIENSELILFNSSPNPFNASTALSYKLQSASNVKLAIYDIAGREVAVLAEGFYPAGAHQAVWDASGVASGVYFARLQAGDKINTMKLLLVK